MTFVPDGTPPRLREVNEDGGVVVEAHWCMMIRQFRGFHQPDACAVCLRPFPDKPWDDEDTTPLPEPEWVSVIVTKHDDPPYLRHEVIVPPDQP